MITHQSLSGRTAVISGGTAELARECAFALGRYGANVVAGVTEDRGSRFEREAGKNSTAGRVQFVCQRASDLGGESDFWSEAFSALGKVDILVLAAERIDSPAAPERREEIPVEFEARSHYSRGLLRRAEPELRRSHGSVILVVPESGPISLNGPNGSSLDEAVAVAASRGLASELAPEVRINTVVFGPLGLEPPSEESVLGEAKVIHRIPRGRLGRHEDVAEAVAFLASDGARFITGETLFVDGGHRLYWTMGAA